MTLLECLKLYFYTNDSAIATMLPGGWHPRVLPQTANKPFQTTAVVRTVSAPGERPTHDGVSPWSRVRLEITVYATTDLAAEQAVLAIAAKARGTNGYIGGSTNGYLSTIEIQGPRNLTDDTSRLPMAQIDIIGLLNQSTLS